MILKFDKTLKKNEKFPSCIFHFIGVIGGFWFIRPQRFYSSQPGLQFVVMHNALAPKSTAEINFENVEENKKKSSGHWKYFLILVCLRDKRTMALASAGHFQLEQVLSMVQFVSFFRKTIFECFIVVVVTTFAGDMKIGRWFFWKIERIEPSKVLSLM